MWGDVVVGVPLVRDAGEEGVEQVLEAGAVVRLQQACQADAVGGLLRRVLHQIAQQHPVQALPHFTVGIAEPVQRLATELLFSRDGQVAGLEQQRLGAVVNYRLERPQPGLPVRGAGQLPKSLTPFMVFFAEPILVRFQRHRLQIRTVHFTVRHAEPSQSPGQVEPAPSLPRRVVRQRNSSTQELCRLAIQSLLGRQVTTVRTQSTSESKFRLREFLNHLGIVFGTRVEILENAVCLQ